MMWIAAHTLPSCDAPVARWASLTALGCSWFDDEVLWNGFRAEGGWVASPPGGYVPDAMRRAPQRWARCEGCTDE